jgi:hypothetical protein
MIKLTEAFETVKEAKFDRSLKPGENKNFPVFKNAKGDPFIGKKFNGYEEFFRFGPALEANVKSWLTGKTYPQYTTIIWLADAIAPHKGIIIPVEELLEVLNSNDEALKEKLTTIGLPKSLDGYSARQLQMSK